MNRRTYIALVPAALALTATAHASTISPSAVSARSATGATHFAWVELLDGTYVARTQTRSSAGLLGPTHRLSSMATDADEVALAVAPSGAVHFTWTRMDGAEAAVVTRRLTANGRLGRVRPVSDDGYDAAAPQVTVTAAGVVRFTWTRLRDERVRTRRLSPRGVLGPIRDA